MPDLLENLNDSQRQAVTHTTGPLLIVAGAGTGKTTVLTRRYVHLLQAGDCTVDHILALTFTEKAASEMEDRIIKLLPTGAYDFWISTFHGFCQRILEAHALEIGLPNQFRLLTETDAWIVLRRRLNELPLKHYKPLGNPVKFLRGLLSHISRAKDEGVTPAMYAEFVAARDFDKTDPASVEDQERLVELSALYTKYQEILLEEGNLDFGDLLVETLRLFRERPSILKKYRTQFKFIMVDEFQDTNWAQYELIKLLAGDDRNLTIVGDDDQAIYKFRGASLANILQFRDDYPEAVTVALTQNYRSKKEILDAAYSFISKNNPNRLEVRLADTGLSKQLAAMQGDGGTVELLWRASVEEEAESVIDSIKNKKQQNPELPWSEVAILVRSNDGAEPFVRACERANIPFQFLALRGLYAKPVILDLVSVLSLLDSYHQSSAVWRALTLPCFHMSATDIASLLQHAQQKGIPLWSAVKNAAYGVAETGLNEEGMQHAKSLVSIIEKLAESAKRELPLRILQMTLNETGYLDMIVHQDEASKVESLAWLNAFAARIRRYEQSTHGPSLRGFLEEFQTELESGEEGSLANDPEAGPDVVKIMTVHASKGLEFKHVFVVSLVDQRFPSRSRSESIPLPDGLVKERLPEGDAHLEEERRLFYVALTRAKESVTITGAFDYGGTREKKPSIFVKELELIVPEQLGPLVEPQKRLKVEEVAEVVHQPLHLYTLKKKFSFTQLAAFRKCPLQYKFAHVYRIPILGSHQKTFGQSLHLAFQRILEQHQLRLKASQQSLFDQQGEMFVSEGGFRVSLEEAEEIFELSWTDEWYESREQHDEYKERGLEAVRSFWADCAKRAPNVLYLEKPFTLVLGNHSLIGKADRVDAHPEGGVIVYDYKTGRAKDTLDAEDKEQLHLYQVALEEMGLEVKSLHYVYVMDWVTKDVEPLTDKKREKFIETLSTRMEAITQSEYEPNAEPFTCRYCDFKNICDFKKL